jgi:[ribosomal protein S18]-alanine N-acetyltransferase
MERIPTHEKEPIKLTLATPADISVLLELEKSVSDRNTYSPMLTENEWREEFKKCVVYLIESEGVVVGNLSYEKKNDDHVYISGLVIDPRFQGKGFARDSLGLLLKDLSDTKRIDLVTHPDNMSAFNLYQSLGFTVESFKEDYYGDGEPRVVMVLK